MKKIAVLGSTGSIGTQTLEIVRTNQDIKVTALAAGNNIELLEQQIAGGTDAIIICGTTGESSTLTHGSSLRRLLRCGKRSGQRN